jgi:hypothetical protein
MTTFPNSSTPIAPSTSSARKGEAAPRSFPWLCRRDPSRLLRPLLRALAIPEPRSLFHIEIQQTPLAQMDRSIEIEPNLQQEAQHRPGVDVTRGLIDLTRDQVAVF